MYHFLQLVDRLRAYLYHAANNRKVFSWDNPPPTGHPGYDYNCRCGAAPIEVANINLLKTGFEAIKKLIDKSTKKIGVPLKGNTELK